MAFSFSPGQIAPQGSQALAPPGTVAPGTAIAPVAGPPSDSPFLFIKERGGPLSILACVQIVLIVVAVLSVIICVVTYSYTIYLKSAIATNKLELEGKDASLPTYPYDDMKKLSKRMSVLDKLLKDYVSPRSPLKFLENIVENQVVFDDFLLARDSKGNFTVTFNAITTNYKVLVQQLGALNLTEYQKIIPNPRLGDVVAGAEMKVTVTSPVFVQGKLPDDIIFFVDQLKTASTSSSLSSATTSVVNAKTSQ